MKNFFNSKYTYGLVSLIIAIWLFISVSAPSALSTRDSAKKQIQQTATKVVTVKNVQVQVNVDDYQYFVTGYPTTVDVKLSGPSALIETTKKTRNFNVSLDLTKLGPGKHKVKFNVTGLNKEIKATTSPETVNVKISKKVSQVFPIQIALEKNSLKSGYKIGTPYANPATATVSGPKSEIKKVVQVVASVDIPRNVKTSVEKEVLLQALDADGKIVNVILSPQTTHISIPITVPSKQVNLKTEQTGKPVDGYEYSFKLNTDSAKVYGDQNNLDELSELSIPVDVSDLKTSTKKTYTLADVFKNKIWSSEPNSVTVEITVKKSSDPDDDKKTSKAKTKKNSKKKVSKKQTRTVRRV
ncbi:CdaR family protein [Lactobacillus sp. YT155]|uniref:CdaR family protein n=1 Tax=Lactobacillus sp. YT155 TaxID=3060955 RepID=UPI00265F0492|nr:CdaR family protein [Lactobacillus sp. YT155]MDO1605061.1 CdaR family protein [Lactobacillus sp. YT155]